MTKPIQHSAEDLAGKYLTLLLDSECYGVPVDRVREIIRLTKLTRVPQMPVYVSGVLNLRGKVIPVLDLRARFGLPTCLGERTCIVVVQVPFEGQRQVQLGLIVDQVEEVVNVAATSIEPPPDVGTVVDTSYLLGIAHTQNRVAMLLDIGCVVGAEAMTPRPEAQANAA